MPQKRNISVVWLVVRHYAEPFSRVTRLVRVLDSSKIYVLNKTPLDLGHVSYEKGEESGLQLRFKTI